MVSLCDDIIVVTSSWDDHTPLLEMVCSRWCLTFLCIALWEFQLGPDPTRFRSGTFCVRWEGVITPDTTVKGGKFQIGLGKSRFTGKTPDGMGGRLWVDGAENALFWSSIGKCSIGAPFFNTKHRIYAKTGSGQT
jgi:hypothetical protein